MGNWSDGFADWTVQRYLANALIFYDRQVTAFVAHKTTLLARTWFPRV